jgi:uncharacterized protein (TIGR00369 family)
VSEAQESVGWDRVVGLTWVEACGDRVVARWDVRPDHHQPYGIVHGGVYCAVIESAASYAGALWLDATAEGGKVVGVHNSTDFLRAVTEGTLTAVAQPIHRGRSTQLWAVEIRDESERLVARGQVRLQNLTG